MKLSGRNHPCRRKKRAGDETEAAAGSAGDLLRTLEADIGQLRV